MALSASYGTEKHPIPAHRDLLPCPIAERSCSWSEHFSPRESGAWTKSYVPAFHESWYYSAMILGHRATGLFSRSISCLPLGLWRIASRRGPREHVRGVPRSTRSHIDLGPGSGDVARYPTIARSSPGGCRVSPRPPRIRPNAAIEILTVMSRGAGRKAARRLLARLGIMMSRHTMFAASSSDHRENVAKKTNISQPDMIKSILRQ